MEFIKKHGIKPEKIDSNHKVASIGFSEKEQKWYGWSHRAYNGFGIGSKVKKGDIAFEPSNLKEFEEANLNFIKDEYKENFRIEFSPNKTKMTIFYSYSNKVKNKQLIGKENSWVFYVPKKWGKGEWTAKTLEDAKEMAIAFAKAVS